MSSILDFIINDDDNNLLCLHVNSLNTSLAKCNFTKFTDSCAYDGILYDFTHLAYCDIGDHYRAATLCVLFAIVLVLFLAMGIVADEFLCPALLTISKTLRLPDNIAGVTFLAFGNGAPDIFSAISGVSQSKPQLIFSGLYGAGIFVSTVVVGSVLLTGEFEVMQRPLIRDIAFYIGATFMVWYIIWKSRIYLKHAIALVLVYICYIGVVIVGRYFYMKTKKGKEGTIENSSTDSTDLSVTSGSINRKDDNRDPEAFGSNVDFKRTKVLTTKRQRSKSLSDNQDIILTRFYRKGTLRTPRHSRTNSFAKKQHLAHHHHENILHVIERNYDKDFNKKIINNNEVEEEIPERKPKRITFMSQVSAISVTSLLSMETVNKALTESKEFFIHISPVDIMEWSEYPWYKKIMECVKAIPYFIMTLCIPVVDLESPKNNWCRLLTCVNVIFAPQIALFFLNRLDSTIGHDFPVWGLCLIISFIAAIIIYLTSNPEEPPIYNSVFAFLGFGVSVLFINAIAGEVINILETLGIMFSLSDSILGLTILAWGNSLGDLISDLTMARHGYPGIGISACFGGPLLNLLLGLGLPYTILLVDEPETGMELVYNRMVTLLYTTITISLVSSMALFIANRFHSTKIHGIYLICIYVVYVVFAVLIESKIL